MALASRRTFTAAPVHAATVARSNPAVVATGPRFVTSSPQPPHKLGAASPHLGGGPTSGAGARASSVGAAAGRRRRLRRSRLDSRCSRLQRRFRGGYHRRRRADSRCRRPLRHLSYEEPAVIALQTHIVVISRRRGRVAAPALRIIHVAGFISELDIPHHCGRQR